VCVCVCGCVCVCVCVRERERERCEEQHTSQRNGLEDEGLVSHSAAQRSAAHNVERPALAVNAMKGLRPEPESLGAWACGGSGFKSTS
jgi:hypothetical protein